MEKQNETIKNFSDEVIKAEYERRFMKEPKAQDDTITEYCPHCESEITIKWNIEKDGYKAFCGYCGNRLMLCSECDNDCNYDRISDTCKHNPTKTQGDKIRAMSNKELVDWICNGSDINKCENCFYYHKQIECLGKECEQGIIYDNPDLLENENEINESN